MVRSVSLTPLLLLALALALIAIPTSGHTAGPAARAPSLPDPGPSATTPSAGAAHLSHRSHRSHTHAHRRRSASLVPDRGVATQEASRTGDGLPGSPAPMPNENAGPPNQQASPDPHLEPGNLSIHYPPIGEGYVAGSSPQAMDDRNAQKVPGLTVSVPLHQGTGDTTPTPDH